MSFDQGEILALELPFSNLDGSKLRAVLVISNTNYNNSGNDMVVVKITGSNFNTIWDAELVNKNLSTVNSRKQVLLIQGSFSQ